MEGDKMYCIFWVGLSNKWPVALWKLISIDGNCDWKTFTAIIPGYFPADCEDSAKDLCLRRSSLALPFSRCLHTVEPHWLPVRRWVTWRYNIQTQQERRDERRSHVLRQPARLSNKAGGERLKLRYRSHYAGIDSYKCQHYRYLDWLENHSSELMRLIGVLFFNATKWLIQLMMIHKAYSRTKRRIIIILPA